MPFWLTGILLIALTEREATLVIGRQEASMDM
jgi:hypothetical protein